jgi:hypothetical protein
MSIAPVSINNKIMRILVLGIERTALARAAYVSSGALRMTDRLRKSTVVRTAMTGLWYGNASDYSMVFYKLQMPR